MPKAILEYDLNDEYDKNAYKRALDSTKAYLALHDIGNKLRSMDKYQSVQGQQEITDLLQNNEGCERLVELIREIFFEILDENKIDMNDLE